MATKKNNKNVTKVICQNCGAEVIIPQHESTVVGTIIGQDSGLGTVVMPTKGGGADVLAQLTQWSCYRRYLVETQVPSRRLWNLSVKLRRVAIWM